MISWNTSRSQRRTTSKKELPPMFDNTQLPLALIMEEILEWEKKEDKEAESNNNQQLGTTSEKS